MMNKIVIFGSNGMLGYAACRYFETKNWSVKKVSRQEFDIFQDNHQKVNDIISECDYVLNCAGVIKQRSNIITDEEMIKVNLLFPRNLGLSAAEQNIKVINISTDCAYDGRKGNYTEKDLFTAEDIYGMSKVGGENNFCMNLRTSIVGEENANGHSLFEWARSNRGKEVQGYTNHIWNGVTTAYLSELIDKIFQYNLYQEGVFHIHSPDSVSKFELLVIFNEVYNLDLKISPIETEIGVDRSLSSIYKFSSEIATKDIKEQLNEMKKFFE